MSDVSICNRALQKLGVPTQLTSLADDNTAGRAMRLAYDPIRKAELRRRRWRFSITRRSIAALTAEPDSDFDYQYQLPNDCLRLLEGGDLVAGADLTDYRSVSGALYSVEGRRILTNLAAPLSIRYIYDVTDTSLFDSAFEEALVARLAMETCLHLTESSSKMESLRADYKLALKEAMGSNSVEKASDQPVDDTWIMARTQ